VRAVRGKWQVAGPGGANPPVGAPSAACHWRSERRTSPAMPSTPLHGLAARHVPTYPNRPSRVLISRSSPSHARMRAYPSSRRPPLPPLGEHRAPADFLAHPRAPALPCEPQHLPEPRVDQTESTIRRSPSLSGRRRTAVVELTPPPLLQSPLPVWCLPWVTWKLPVQHVVEPRPFPHRRRASRGRAAAAPPPPLAGVLTGRSTAANQ
jgi:hypothetical protein